jgi:tryptophan synthase alpha chain
VGFGISTPAQASSVAEIADGVIVGSRLVRAASEGGPGAVGELVSELTGALTRPR